MPLALGRRMKLTFWGVRGSIATSGPEFARIGGNTTCLEVSEGRSRLILDAGTGLRALGTKLLAESRELGTGIEASFLFTHLHWDHVQGFPFFAPAYVPSTKLSLFGPVDENGVGLEEVLSRQMQPPSFPVPLSAMGSQKRFGTIGTGSELSIGPFEVRMRALCHPQGSLGFRIEAGKRAICFATDTECDEKEIDPSILELARGVDLLIYDAQYTEEEYRTRKGWGHSTYVAAALVACAAGAKRLALFHHDPAHDDDAVEAIERDARSIFCGAFAAREGLTLDV
jgi:phosphoribosyl 1,2-cyclic phosphodiesterase